MTSHTRKITERSDFDHNTRQYFYVLVNSESARINDTSNLNMDDDRSASVDIRDSRQREVQIEHVTGKKK